MNEIKLYKKHGKYIDKDGVGRNTKSFYLKCGDELIPIDVKYFGTQDKPDKQFVSRRSVLSAFSEVLPEKQ